MKTAVIYARYSSASQTEQSIEGQLHVCTQYAKANDLIVVDTYIDRATTGTNDNRAAFQQMLKDSENAAWEVVLVYAIDRFGRNSVEVALNKQRLKTNGKVLISATQRTSDNLDGTKNLDGILLENVYIGIAEYYSAELSQKILRGLRESRRKGQFCGGKIPYGYYVTDKKVQVDEEKAEVVRFIFRQYAAGVYVPKIICKLNEKGLLHNGKPFLPNAIYGILRNERYLGIMRIRDEVYDNIYPQIVDADLYEKVKRKLIKNKIGSRSVKEVYLLRNKVKCGYCGNIISAECGTARNGETIRYYKCLGRKKHHNGCSKHPVRKESLEELVLDSVDDAMPSLDQKGRKEEIKVRGATRVAQEQYGRVPVHQCRNIAPHAGQGLLGLKKVVPQIRNPFFHHVRAVAAKAHKTGHAAHVHALLQGSVACASAGGWRPVEQSRKLVTPKQLPGPGRCPCTPFRPGILQGIVRGECKGSQPLDEP